MIAGSPYQLNSSISECRRLTILGATGSIGKSTLDLVARHPSAFKVAAVTANGNAKALAACAIKHGAELAVLADEKHYSELCSHLDGTGVRAAAGPAALCEAAEVPADCIMAGIVGAAGIIPTVAAARQGTRLALANKECLVSAGDVFMREVAQAGTELLPVDSEHSAVFQVIRGNPNQSIEKIVITASGGPFRTWTKDKIASATAAQALKHPNWSMGDKITIDSATLMNKGLELIEAMHLFQASPSSLDCVVHPQSIVHCLVTFKDGSVLAQLASPDMRTPIAVALAWPSRMDAPTERLDLASIGSLHFEPPDEDRFPALRIAKAAMARGGGAPAVLNAANEIAVAAFLAGKLDFYGIPAVVEDTLMRAEQAGLTNALTSIDEVIATDEAGRRLAAERLHRYV